jgi:hypothetical protein
MRWLVLALLAACTNAARFGGGPTLSSGGTGGQLVGTIGGGHTVDGSHAIMGTANVGVAWSPAPGHKAGFVDVFGLDIVSMPAARGIGWRAGPHAGIHGKDGVFGVSLGVLPFAKRKRVGHRSSDDAYTRNYPVEDLMTHDRFFGPGVGLSLDYVRGPRSEPPLWMLTLSMELEWVSLHAGH